MRKGPRDLGIVGSSFAAAAVTLGGCSVACPDGARLSRGMDRRSVEKTLGVPDVVSERAGAEQRLYRGDQQPGMPWRAYQTTLYYLDRDLAVPRSPVRVSACACIGDDRGLVASVLQSLPSQPSEGQPQ